MTNDLVRRLVEFEFSDNLGNGDFSVCYEAADRITELEKQVHQAKVVFATMRSEMSSVCAVMEAFENE